MSYETLTRQAQDPVFMNRITACTQKEAWANPEFGATDFGVAVQHNQVAITTVLGWPVSIDTELAYEYAVGEGNPNPGGDPAVITDAAIQAAVQVHWPDVWPPPAPVQP